MEAYLSYVGVLGSGISMAATLYFWLVRVNRERPCLKPHLIDRELFLGVSRDGVRQIGVKAGVLVANHSTLPNAILGARLSVRLADGWRGVGQLAFDKATPHPLNLPPLQTVLLCLTGTLSLPYQDALEDGAKTVANYLKRFVAQPLEMKLELRHLSQGTQHMLRLPADLEPSETASRPVSAAA